jgi:hypothetical protein
VDADGDLLQDVVECNVGCFEANEIGKMKGIGKEEIRRRLGN